MFGNGILRGDIMTDSLKIVKKNFIVAFKNDIKNIFVLVPLMFIGYLIYKNKYNDIMIPLQLLSGYVSTVSAYSVVIIVMTKEDASKTSLILKSLPLKQKSTVIGFYMFSAIIVFIATIGVSIFPALKSIIEKDITYVSSTLIINLTLGILIPIIALPFIFKFGYSKTKTTIKILLDIIFPFMLVLYYIRSLYTGIYVIAEIEAIVNMITDNFVATTIGCIILYLISMTISIKAYNNDN